MTLPKVSFRPLWRSFLFLFEHEDGSGESFNLFPSPMRIFFISIKKKVYTYEKNHNSRVSVPYGVLFYFYLFGTDAFEPTDPAAFPSPLGIFFISIIC